MRASAAVDPEPLYPGGRFTEEVNGENLFNNTLAHGKIN